MESARTAATLGTGWVEVPWVGRSVCSGECSPARPTDDLACLRILGPMNAPTAPTTGLARVRVILLALIVAASFLATAPAGLLAVESSPLPEAGASLDPTLAPADAVCQSASDLALIIDFLRGTDPSVDGWVPVLVGVIAGLSEARDLAGFAGDTYQPLVDDLTASLEGLRATIDELGDQATVGAQLAAIGEAITDIGNAMDSLAVQLQTPCPTDA